MTKTINRSLSAMTATLIALAVLSVSQVTKAEGGCTPSSTWCCWPPYPAEPTSGAHSGQCSDTDCNDPYQRGCNANSPFAYFTANCGWCIPDPS